ncbi:MAG: biotin attachment protein, partial [Chlorobium sp.]|nr:biotin attachment protein [Chlorobium sp.]
KHDIHQKEVNHRLEELFSKLPPAAPAPEPSASKVISMAGNFTVFVDGAPYTVSFAEGSAINPQSVAVPPVAEALSAPQHAGTPVPAVMPGNVFSISVKVGDEVKEGEEVAVIEAMKMETPVKAPCAGRILSITVAKGDTVGMGEIMMTIE